MRMATCICGEAGSVNVSGEGFGRTFTRGATVDLDESVLPEAEVTWGDAIGERHAHLFEEAADLVFERSPRRERSADVAEAIAARGVRAEVSE